jgi:raffinose/stachyose/melibiose transport system permease protein
VGDEKKRGGGMNNLGAGTGSIDLSRRIGSAIILLFLLAGAVVMLFPIYMGLLNSVKTQSEMLTNILSFPAHFQFANYPNAFAKIHFVRSLLNTLQIVAIGLFGIIVCASLAGYKLSRTKGKWSAFLFGLFIRTRCVLGYFSVSRLCKINPAGFG